MGALLGNILGGNLLSTVKGLIEEFHASPELKAQMQAAVDANAAQIALAQIKLQESAQDELAREVEAASANIRAEAGSGDKYTSRARPSFVYVMLGILTANFIAFPLLGKPALAFPDALFWLFGSCMLGYTGARTWEKVANISQGK
jgi:hypothetical protein